jgi:acetyltransferase
MRFFQPLTDIPHEQMVRYCHVDYDREIAFLACIEEDDRERIIGIGRLNLYPGGEEADLAVVVADAWARQGVGRQLCDHCIVVARSRAIRLVFMDVLRQNVPMKGLAVKLGFEEIPAQEEDMVRYRLDLTAKGASRGTRRRSRKSPGS